MTVRFDVRGVDEAKAALAGISGQLPYATAVALNNMGKETIAAQREEMHRRFDRPTPYTLNALFYTRASKEEPVTRTRIKSPVVGEPGQTEERYVGVQIWGGSRKDKMSERFLRSRGLLPDGYQMVPGAGLPRDRYGNVTGGTVQSILKAISNYSGGIVKARAGTIVVGEVGGTKGIWKVQINKWVPFFIYVKKPRYQSRLNYYGVSEDLFERRWKTLFGEAIDKALATAR